MKIRIMLLAILVAMMAGGCTQNNGNIGDLFGEWRLEELKADGKPQKLYDDEVLLYTWEFQNSLVFIQTIMPHQDYRTSRGTWTREGDILAIDFSHRDNDGPYLAPEALHLENGGVTPLHVITLDGKNLRAEYTATDGVKYEYVLRKAY